jgi:probable rRNA maturation factor
MGVTEPVVAIAVAGAGAERGPQEAAAGLLGLDEATLRQVAAVTLARVGITQPVELSVLVTDDAALRALNRAYRGRDEVTDVLSFPLLDAPLAAAPADQLWGATDATEGEDLAAPDRDPQLYPAVIGYGEEDDPSAEQSAEDLTDEAESPFAFIAPPDLPLHLGDIVVARDMTERQALQAHHSAGWELAFLVAHGVLHLVGFDDQTDAGYAAMVAHQEAVLRAVGISA